MYHENVSLDGYAIGGTATAGADSLALVVQIADICVLVSLNATGNIEKGNVTLGASGKAAASIDMAATGFT